MPGGGTRSPFSLQEDDEITKEHAEPTMIWTHADAHLAYPTIPSSDAQACSESNWSSKSPVFGTKPAQWKTRFAGQRLNLCDSEREQNYLVSPQGAR